MNTDDEDGGASVPLLAPTLLGWIGGSSACVVGLEERLELGTTEGSSKCPAGVNNNAPSGLKVKRLKKLVKPSSPYSFTDAHEGVAAGVRMAGRGGIGEGERPKFREERAGEPGLAAELKDERRDLLACGFSFGGYIADTELVMEAVGVGGALMGVSWALLEELSAVAAARAAANCVV
jgi:hypothetical protein